MPIQFGTPFVGTSIAHAAVIAVVLFCLTVPLALRMGRKEGQPWLANIIIVGLLLHFLGSVLQIFVVRIAYSNIADFNGYDGQGELLSQAWRSGNFSFVGLSLDIPGTGMASLITGAVYTVVGVDQLGGFLVFTWFSLLGLVMFYRAFRILVPAGEHKRYAALLFLLPSLFYWPSVAGKEAVMMLALGAMTLGAAHLFKGHLFGLAPMLAGTILGGLIRPHEIAMLFGSFAVAILTRRAVRKTLVTPVRWVVTFVVVGVGGAVIAKVTAAFLGLTSLTPSALVETLTDANDATQGEGVGFGSSHSTWSPNPLYFPYDVYTVLFKPLPFEVTSATQAFAALENLTIIAIFCLSWRSILAVFGQLRDSPYVVMCVVYTIGFIYLFSALGNVGLLARERTLLFPVMFVLLSLPSKKDGAAGGPLDDAEVPDRLEPVARVSAGSG